MQKVYCIDDPSLLKEIIEFLDNRRGKTAERDALLFVLGVELGLRISDLLKLRVYDVKDKDILIYTSKKTKESISVSINKDTQRRIKHYIKDRPIYDYLFSTTVSDRMTRQNASRIMKLIADEFCLENFNTHSLRKTYAHFLYIKSGQDLALVQITLGHKSPVTTMEYLGIQQQYIKEKMKNFSVFS